MIVLHKIWDKLYINDVYYQWQIKWNFNINKFTLFYSKRYLDWTGFYLWK